MVNDILTIAIVVTLTVIFWEVGKHFYKKSKK